MPETIPKSTFVNPDARVRCLTPECLGDLVLFPTGNTDQDGIPEFANATLCPLCMTGFDLDPDITDRELFLRVSWMRANPGAPLPDEVRPEDVVGDDAADDSGDTGRGRP
ncbi:MAG: hypothetical protein ACO3PB_01705 [Miltoncostaeaceae bacterium]